MSLVPGVPNPYVEAFTVGILYGLVFCTSTCLPYIASYIAGVGAGFRKGTVITLIFSSGRVAGYAIIGGLAGLLSAAFGFLISEVSLSSVQYYSSYAFGAVTIVIGVAVYLKSRKAASCECTPDASKLAQPGSGRRFDFGAFSLGLSRGLILCPPLVALLVYSVSFGGPLDSLALAVLFGLGTTISPILLLGGVTGWLLSKAPLFRKWIAIAGAAVLVFLGALAIVNAAVTTPR
ncbi:MAG: sulfite exporter TauE/SafE family protein [Candidatus Bathyarchaeia archaeon]